MFRTLKIKILRETFESESMCFENNQLACKCKKLKNLGKIEEFRKNPFNLVLKQCSQHKAFRKCENPQNISNYRYRKIDKY